ncbi:acetate--CoA ligase [Candidatus Bathyarchaeota archaeon]|nr:acetate--CoA ligase [Candidatus Bathyarchaeota archaeon]
MNPSSLQSLPTEERISPINKLMDYWKYSLEKPNEFWGEQAKQLDWYRTWDKVLEWSNHHAEWFKGGSLNASFNCLDRHLSTNVKNKVALFWEGEPGDKRAYTYQQLYIEVNKFASLLKKKGIQKGDTVALYMPMIPELPIAMLACSRIGAPFTQVYSGFSTEALAERVRHLEAKILVTSDGLWRRGKIVDLKSIVDAAVDSCPSIQNVFVVRRTEHEVNMMDGRDLWYQDEMEKTPIGHIEPEQMASEDVLYVLYTSGTTAKPKGVQVSTGGYLTYVASTLKWSFDVNQMDVWWCAADIGWVTGHSYIVFGPLIHGLTSIMYEGAPEFPDPGRIWRMIQDYSVSKFYTSPTLIRHLMKYGDEYLNKYDLSSLTILGTVGEPINPDVWRWYYRTVGKEKCPVSDTWWQTETGGFMIAPAPGIDLQPLKPGSATHPLPGIDPIIIDEDGQQVPDGVKGYLAIKKPWPGMLMTLYKDDERYQEYYWQRYPGSGQDLFYTGDYAVKDRDGYYWLLGRSDDVLKVAGHRLGTIELEDCLVSHPAVVEAAVVGKKDEIKGEVPVCFVVLKHGFNRSQELVDELKLHIRNTIGPVASPADIYFVPNMPKTRSGKIMRRVIKSLTDGESVGDLTTLEDQNAVDEIIKLVYPRK